MGPGAGDFQDSGELAGKESAALGAWFVWRQVVCLKPCSLEQLDEQVEQVCEQVAVHQDEQLEQRGKHANTAIRFWESGSVNSLNRRVNSSVNSSMNRLNRFVNRWAATL